MSNLKLEFILSMIDKATAPVRKVVGALDGLAEPAGRIREALGGVQAAIGRIVRGAAAAAGAVAAIFYGFKKTSDTVDGLNDAAQALGMTTQQYQRMGYAAQLSGSSQDEMAQSLMFLNKNMGEARNGSKETQEWFTRVGVSLKDLRTMNAGQIFEKISDKFEAVGDGGQNAGKKIEVSTNLLGRSGFRMIQMMNGGSKAMKQLYAEADRLGVTLSNDTVKAMADFNDSWDRMRLTVFGAVANSFKLVAPIFQDIVERITKWTVANRALIATKVKDFIDKVTNALPAFVQEVEQLADGIGRFLSLAGQVGSTLGGWPNLFAVLAGVMGANLVLSVYSLAAALGVMSAAVWANPLTWILAAVVALIAAIPLLVLHFDKVVEKLHQLRDAMPDWMQNKDNWLVTKLLPDVNLKPAPEGSWGPPVSKREAEPEGRWEAPGRAAGVASVPVPGKVAGQQRAIGIGGQLDIRVFSDGRVAVDRLKQQPGSPLNLSVYNGRMMMGG